MMLGGTLCWAIFVPILQHQGVVRDSGFDALIHGPYGAAHACMVTSGLFSLALQWRSMLRALGNVAGAFTGNRRLAASEMDRIETPTSWFLAGQWLRWSPWPGWRRRPSRCPTGKRVIAVPLAFLLSLVACRVTGETDNTPVSAMGQTTQLIFGGLSPSGFDIATRTNVTLMSGEHHGRRRELIGRPADRSEERLLAGGKPAKAVPGTVCRHLRGDRRDGALLPAPRAQRQGAGRRQFPAPSAPGVAGRLGGASRGIKSLGPVKAWSMAMGALVGILLPLLALIFPKHRKWIPSAAGVGLAWTFQWYYSLLFFLGALIGYGWERKSPEQSREFCSRWPPGSSPAAP